MKSAYFRELKRYTKAEIATALQTTVDNITPIIRKLKSYGVVKAIKATPQERHRFELSEDDIEIGDVDIDISNQLFVFDYVGVVTVENFIFKCYPKYISKKIAPLDEMKQTIQVLRKYNSQEQIISMANGLDEKSPFNMLAIMLFIINDYCEFGAYSNQRDITEINGEGEIEWDKTINETYAVISKNRPYYLDLYTINSVDDDADYFRRLHLSIVSECSEKLKEAELTSLFSLNEIYPSDEIITEFGNEEYILYRINRELNVQFVTRKQMLLKTMYAFISQRRSMFNGLGLSMYGTTSFNLVWEKVCGEVFGNLLNTKLSHLPIPIANTYLEHQNKTLIELIEKPVWRAKTSSGNHEHRVRDTLTPDLISIYSCSEGQCFGIFDAKYYNIKLDKHKVEGQPGVGDITKQYLYQLAYKEFVEAHSFKNVQNAFLFPSETSEAKILGEAEMSILKTGLNLLKNIMVVKLPASKMYQWYLNGKKVDISVEFPFL